MSNNRPSPKAHKNDEAFERPVRLSPHEVQGKLRRGLAYRTKKLPKPTPSDSIVGLRNEKTWISMLVFNAEKTKAEIKAEIAADADIQEHKEKIRKSSAAAAEYVRVRSATLAEKKQALQDAMNAPQPNSDLVAELNIAIMHLENKIEDAAKFIPDYDNFDSVYETPRYNAARARHNRIADIEVLGQEAMRRDIPGQQKTRKVTAANGNIYVISEEVVHTKFPTSDEIKAKQDLHKKILDGTVFGLAPIFFNAWKYSENDLHTGNMIIDENGQVIKIDGEDLFISIWPQEKKNYPLTTADYAHITNVQDMKPYYWCDNWEHSTVDGRLKRRPTSLKPEERLLPLGLDADPHFLRSKHKAAVIGMIWPNDWLAAFVECTIEDKKNAQDLLQEEIVRTEGVRAAVLNDAGFQSYILDDFEVAKKDFQDYLEYLYTFRTNHSSFYLNYLFDRDMPKYDAHGQKYLRCSSKARQEAHAVLMKRFDDLHAEAQVNRAKRRLEEDNREKILQLANQSVVPPIKPWKAGMLLGFMTGVAIVAVFVVLIATTTLTLGMNIPLGVTLGLVLIGGLAKLFSTIQSEFMGPRERIVKAAATKTVAISHEDPKVTQTSRIKTTAEIHAELSRAVSSSALDALDALKNKGGFRAETPFSLRKGSPSSSVSTGLTSDTPLLADKVAMVLNHTHQLDSRIAQLDELARKLNHDKKSLYISPKSAFFETNGSAVSSVSNELKAACVMRNAITQDLKLLHDIMPIIEQELKRNLSATNETLLGAQDLVKHRIAACETCLNRDEQQKIIAYEKVSMGRDDQLGEFAIAKPRVHRQRISE